MKKLFNAKWLLLVVLMLSLTSMDADAQRRTINIWQVTVDSPEGYSNLRATPGGRIIGKVYNNNKIWVEDPLNPNNNGKNWHKVYTSTGKFRGYIHITQFKLPTDYGSDTHPIREVRVNK